MIVGTGRAWQSALSHIGPERLNAAFDNVERTAERWPSPKFILDNLPAYFVTFHDAEDCKALENGPLSDELKKANRERIENMLKELQGEKP